LNHVKDIWRPFLNISLILAIGNLKKHLILALLILNFAIWFIQRKKKGGLGHLDILSPSIVLKSTAGVDFVLSRNMEDRVFVFFVACAGLVGRGACASDIVVVVVVGVEFFLLRKLQILSLHRLFGSELRRLPV
jgi:hypothetical protein